MKANEMLRTHPNGATHLDWAVVASTIEDAMSCAQTCTSCADACLAEKMVADLRRCIRLNLDCADICQTTARVLSRRTEPVWDVLRAQVGSCFRVCGECADECAAHADMHEHCRVCAEECRRCEEACSRLLKALEEAAISARTAAPSA